MHIYTHNRIVPILPGISQKALGIIYDSNFKTSKQTEKLWIWKIGYQNINHLWHLFLLWKIQLHIHRVNINIYSKIEKDLSGSKIDLD